jgi:hypothetical protein
MHNFGASICPIFVHFGAHAAFFSEVRLFLAQQLKILSVSFKQISIERRAALCKNQAKS